MEKTDGVSDPSAKFQSTRQRAVDAGDKVLSAISAALTQGERAQAEPSLEQLDFLFVVVAMADEATRLQRQVKLPSEAAEPAVPDYVVSSWFLVDCQAYLLSHPSGHEVLHLVTGSKVGENQRTLDRMVKVALADQSMTHALADQHDLQKRLIEIDERWGHYLHGLFHSHPGMEASATQPSNKDWLTQERYERGGYPLVGAIFVKDFVRFFANHPFIITIYGKGVEACEEHVFKIGPVSH